MSEDDALAFAEALIAAYCRDRHRFPDGTDRPGVEHCRKAVARRLLANPDGVTIRETVGPYTRFVDGSDRANGLTHAEMVILGRYRKQAM